MNGIKATRNVSIKCNKTYIPLIEPVQDLYNYRFYHLATSHNSIVLSNKRTCHVIFFYSLFTTKKKGNQLFLLAIVLQSLKVW